MREEDYERLLSDLEEVKGSFDILIEEMKEKNIPYSYDQTVPLVEKIVEEVRDFIEKMKIKRIVYEDGCKRNKALLRHIRLLKIIRGIILSLLAYVFYLYNSKVNIAPFNKLMSNLVFAGFGVATGFGIRNEIKASLKEDNNQKEYDDIEEARIGCKGYYKAAVENIAVLDALNRELWGELGRPRMLN